MSKSVRYHYNRFLINLDIMILYDLVYLKYKETSMRSVVCGEILSIHNPNHSFNFN